ncbi:MAG: hypothetical protein RH917_07910 [Lacipirellulaceae bacterium]
MCRVIPFLFSVLCVAAVAVAHPPALPKSESPAVTRQQAVAAIRNAEQQLHRFRYIQYPRLVKQLDAAIRLAEAELAVSIDRVENYRPFRTFNQYSPAYFAEQTWRLRTLAAQQRLKELREERLDLSRYQRDVVAGLQSEINCGVALLKTLN